MPIHLYNDLVKETGYNFSKIFCFFILGLGKRVVYAVAVAEKETPWLG